MRLHQGVLLHVSIHLVAERARTRHIPSYRIPIVSSQWTEHDFSTSAGYYDTPSSVDKLTAFMISEKQKSHIQFNVIIHHAMWVHVYLEWQVMCLVCLEPSELDEHYYIMY